MSDGRCPFAVWIGSPNFGYGRGTHGQLTNPLAVVDHIMCGTLDGCDSWFNNPDAFASSHFGIGKDGRIHQYVDLNDCAWANGAVIKPSARAAPVVTVNPNTVTWSVEHEGQPKDEWTDAMYVADLRLKRYLWQRKSGLLLLGHCDIDSVNKSNCPGPHWPRERLLAELEEPMAVFSQEQLNQMAALTKKAIEDDMRKDWHTRRWSSGLLRKAAGMLNTAAALCDIAWSDAEYAELGEMIQRAKLNIDAACSVLAHEGLGPETGDKKIEGLG